MEDPQLNHKHYTRLVHSMGFHKEAHQEDMGDHNNMVLLKGLLDRMVPHRGSMVKLCRECIIDCSMSVEKDGFRRIVI